MSTKTRTRNSELASPEKVIFEGRLAMHRSLHADTIHQDSGVKIAQCRTPLQIPFQLQLHKGKRIKTMTKMIEQNMFQF